MNSEMSMERQGASSTRNN